jgi:hypothetical protein
MSIDLTAPPWLLSKCSLWIERLQMGEWDVQIKLALVLNEDPECRGTAEAYPDISLGRIELRADIEDNAEGETTLVHELLHIKHGRIDDVINRVLEPQINVPTPMVKSVYRLALEPFIDSLSKALVKLAKEEP